MLEALPDRRVDIDRLINQHERIIDILEMARLHLQGGEASEAGALRQDLEQFLEMFRQHELEEERLLIEAIEREEAGLD